MIIIFIAAVVSINARYASTCAPIATTAGLNRCGEIAGDGAATSGYSAAMLVAGHVGSQ
jgi:hypothetical protein